MSGKFVITESERNEIRRMYGLINEQDDVISQYVSDPRLQKILRDLQTQLGENFTKEHFDYEISVSGNVKKEAGALLPEVIEAFNKMKKESGCPNILINEKVSYRTYEMQRDQFLKYATQSPKINTALKQAAIPGFSAHHTGTAIDYYEDGAANLDCLTKGAWPNGDYNKPNKWGFTLPYMSGKIRKREPWHLQYVGVGTSNQNQSGNQTNQSNKISISQTDLSAFTNEIASKTYGQSLNLDSIQIDLDKKTFSIDRGDTKVFKLVLRYNMAGEKTCPSCDNTVKKNTEYGAEELERGTWENDTRIYSVIVYYPKQ